MGRDNDINYAVFSEKEYYRLLKNNPEQNSLISKLFIQYGKKFRCNISDLDSEIKEKLGHDLVDTFYHNAYSFNMAQFLQYYFQVSQILSLPKSKLSSILEIGPGLGHLENMLDKYDYQYLSLDIDEQNKPNIVGDVRNIQLDDNSIDMVCAFQMLEHIPYSQFLLALKEMSRVSRRYVYISIPCNISSFRLDIDFNINVRYFSRFSFRLEKFIPFILINKIDKDEKELLKRVDIKNPHFWEVGTKSFSKTKILEVFKTYKMRIINDYHNPYNPYHWHILAEK